MGKLEAEKRKLTDQIEFTIDSLASIGQEPAKKSLLEFEGKRTTVTAKLVPTWTAISVNEPADVVAEQITTPLRSTGQRLEAIFSKFLREISPQTHRTARS